MQGIIVPTQKVKLSDFLGDYGYLGTILRQSGTEPMPSLSDIRRVISLFAIFPLGELKNNQIYVLLALKSRVTRFTYDTVFFL